MYYSNRLSLQNVEKLGDEILYQLRHSRIPKVLISHKFPLGG